VDEKGIKVSTEKERLDHDGDKLINKIQALTGSYNMKESVLTNEDGIL